jgi:hypothetical protein
VKVSTSLIVIDQSKLAQKLNSISTQVSSLSIISSDDDYDLAYSIRAKIKSVITWVQSITKPKIKERHDAHKSAISYEKKLIQPFESYDSQLDSMMKEWNRLKKAEEAKQRELREREDRFLAESILLDDAQFLLSSDSESDQLSGINLLSQVESGDVTLPEMPDYITLKPRGERLYKRIRILDVTKLNPEFIIHFLSDENTQETLRKWLESQCKLLGGFESLESLAGQGSIEQVEVDSINIR